MLAPISQLGTDYVVSMLSGGGPEAINPNDGIGFSVTATTDNTVVTVIVICTSLTAENSGFEYNDTTYLSGDVIVETLDKYENMWVSYSIHYPKLS